MNISTNNLLTMTPAERAERQRDEQKSAEFLAKVALFLEWFTPAKALLYVSLAIFAFVCLALFLGYSHYHN